MMHNEVLRSQFPQGKDTVQVYAHGGGAPGNYNLLPDALAHGDDMIGLNRTPAVYAQKAIGPFVQTNPNTPPQNYLHEPMGKTLDAVRDTDKFNLNHSYTQMLPARFDATYGNTTDNPTSNAIKNIASKKPTSAYSIACNHEGGGSPDFYNQLLGGNLKTIGMVSPGRYGQEGKTYANVNVPLDLKNDSSYSDLRSPNVYTKVNAPTVQINGGLPTNTWKNNGPFVPPKPLGINQAASGASPILPEKYKHNDWTPKPAPQPSILGKDPMDSRQDKR